MLYGIALIVAVAAAGFVGFKVGFKVAKKRSAVWFVQPRQADKAGPRTPRAAAPDTDTPATSSSVFARTNLPGSNTTMD